ncbi:MAG: hypothetical protein NTX64_13890 [Elusimicrobia bacterium]|nr:hypothetical protein [Elusimicrobiota bacterium]
MKETLKVALGLMLACSTKMAWAAEPKAEGWAPMPTTPAPVPGAPALADEPVRVPAEDVKRLVAFAKNQPGWQKETGLIVKHTIFPIRDDGSTFGIVLYRTTKDLLAMKDKRYVFIVRPDGTLASPVRVVHESNHTYSDEMIAASDLKDMFFEEFRFWTNFATDNRSPQ